MKTKDMPFREALRNAAAALKEHGPRFALAGSYALWAYGAPEPSHDADVVVTESDAAAPAQRCGMPDFRSNTPRRLHCREARAGETVVDVLHRLNGVPVQGAMLDRAEQRDVLAIAMPVLPPTLVLIQKAAFLR